MEEIQKIQKEMREAIGVREAGAQAFIRGLTAEVATQQGAADQLPASQVRSPRLMPMHRRADDA